MREIKFRVWKKNTNEMFYDVQNDYYFETFINSKRFELMQYTGLKDKNGKEIYEGDILKFTDCLDEFMPFTKKISDVYWFNEYSRFAMRNTEMNLSYLLESEVIGNIHENPELLK